MAAMRGLNAGLGAIALRFRLSERLAHSGKVGFDIARFLLQRGKFSAQRFQSMLALDDARVVIRAAAHAQPVAPHPLTAAGDERLSRGQCRAPLQRLGQGVCGKNMGQLRSQRGRTCDLAQQQSWLMQNGNGICLGLGAVALLRAAAPTGTDAVIVAAVRLSDHPNYSWASTISDDARTYDVEGRTQKGGFTRVKTLANDSRQV